MEFTPDYFGFVCISQGKEGGKSQFISTYSIHNRIFERNPEVLETLYQPFHFDLRGDIIDGKKTAQKPVFFDTKHGTGITYLRKYINAGHAYEDVPDLTEKQKAALDAVDSALEDQSLIAEGYIQPGEVVFFNNMAMIHGRTAFEDHDDPSKKRVLFRTWIKSRD